MTGSPIYKYEQLQKNEALCDILYINLYSPKKTVAHKKTQQRKHKYKQSENSENSDQVQHSS